MDAADVVVLTLEGDRSSPTAARSASATAAPSSPSGRHLLTTTFQSAFGDVAPDWFSQSPSSPHFATTPPSDKTNSSVHASSPENLPKRRSSKAGTSSSPTSPRGREQKAVERRNSRRDQSTSVDGQNLGKAMVERRISLPRSPRAGGSLRGETIIDPGKRSISPRNDGRSSLKGVVQVAAARGVDFESEGERLLSLTQLVSELQGVLDRELAERQKAREKHDVLAGRLAEVELQAANWTAELQEVKKERDGLRWQLKEKSDRHADVIKKMRGEQESKKSIDGELSKAEAACRDIEAKIRSEQAARRRADSTVAELQERLLQLEQGSAAVCAAAQEADQSTIQDGVHSVEDGSVKPSTGSLESQLEQLRQQLEETVRVVQNRGACAPGNANETPVTPTSLGSGTLTGAVEEAVSPVNLSLQEKTYPGLSSDATVNAEDHLASGWSNTSLEGHGSSAAVVDTEIGRGRSPSEYDRSLQQQQQQQLLSARRAGLSLRDLSEIKTLKKPPPPVRMLMEICCMLFHISPIKQPDEKCCKKWSYDYWEPARRYLLSDPFFPSKLRQIDPGSVAAAQRAKIMRCFDDPEFTADRVRNCSKAASELYHWIRLLMDAAAEVTDGGEVEATVKVAAGDP